MSRAFLRDRGRKAQTFRGTTSIRSLECGSLLPQVEAELRHSLKAHSGLAITSLRANGRSRAGLLDSFGDLVIKKSYNH